MTISATTCRRAAFTGALLASLGISCAPTPHRPPADPLASRQLLSQPADSCPNANLDPNRNYSGKRLDYTNFAWLDLRNANFEGATLVGAVFLGTNLEGASFKNATFQGGGELNGTDFSFANLREACFIGAKFEDVTYFTYATTACADFSKTDLRTKWAVMRGKGEVITKAVLFGEEGLQGPYSANKCRTRFQSTKMSCEFMVNWPALDLDHADISECLSRLKGMNFGGYTPGASLRGVDFSGGASCNSENGTDLSGTHWQGVDLTGAVLTRAVLDGASFAKTEGAPGAILTDANMVCISAKGASFDGAKLGKNDQGSPGAKLDKSTLKDVTFNGTDLIGASFAGATLSGASLASATLDGSRWDGAKLESLDLTQVTSALGTNFEGATLTSANLKNTKLGRNVYIASGTKTSQASSFSKASLCGATLDLTDLTCADLTGAKLTKDAGCDVPATITRDKDGRYTPITEGITGDDACSTTCPDGSRGPCAEAGQWSAPPDSNGDPCCPTGTCPPGLKPGRPCQSHCDCHSRECVSGTCR